MTELYAATMGLLEDGAKLLYPSYVSKSAFLPDQFEDYFIGLHNTNETQLILYSRRT